MQTMDGLLHRCIAVTLTPPANGAEALPALDFTPLASIGHVTAR